MRVYAYDLATGAHDVGQRDGRRRWRDPRDARRDAGHRLPSEEPGRRRPSAARSRTGREQRLRRRTPPWVFHGGLFSDARRSGLDFRPRHRPVRAGARAAFCGRRARPPGARRPARRRGTGGFALTDDGRAGALVWNVAGRSELELFDLGTGRRTPARRCPPSSSTGVTFSKDGRRPRVDRRGRSDDAGRLRARPDVGAPHARDPQPDAGDRSRHCRAARAGPFPAHDGLELSGWLYRPRGVPGGRRTPHTCSTSTAAPRVRSARRFNAHLSGAARPRHRGVRAERARFVGLRQAFVNLDNGALREDAVRDIKACVDYLATKGSRIRSGSASWAAPTAATW